MYKEMRHATTYPLASLHDNKNQPLGAILCHILCQFTYRLLHMHET